MSLEDVTVDNPHPDNPVIVEKGFETPEHRLNDLDRDESNPECEFCGEEMSEAPDHLVEDWLCQNDGCEGSFQEEELEEESSDKEEKQGRLNVDSEHDSSEDKENVLWKGDNVE